MFTLSQIQQAHSKVRSGADFPRYVQDIIQLGVRKYDCYVHDGHVEYFGDDDFTIRSDAKYPVKEVATKSDDKKFKQSLQIHQQGGTNYPTFCQDAADTGVEKWQVDTVTMTCTYFDKAGKKMLVEKIPNQT